MRVFQLRVSQQVCYSDTQNDSHLNTHCIPMDVLMNGHPNGGAMVPPPDTNGGSTSPPPPPPDMTAPPPPPEVSAPPPPEEFPPPPPSEILPPPPVTTEGPKKKAGWGAPKGRGPLSIEEILQKKKAANAAAAKVSFLPREHIGNCVHLLYPDYTDLSN